MFINHQPRIGQYARNSAENFFQVIQFTLLTIQQSLHTVPDMMQDVNSEGLNSRFLWGVKGNAWQQCKENMQQIYEDCMFINDANPNPKIAEIELLCYLAGLPGLGVVKGGFVAQLAFGLVGCLDTHNVVQHNLPAAPLRAGLFKQASPKTKQRRAKDYLAIVSRLGGCEALWNSWCEYVYDRNRGGVYTSAYHVSETHCVALGLSC